MMHPRDRRRFSAIWFAISMVGSWLILLFVVGVMWFLIMTPFLPTMIRFAEGNAATATPAEQHAPDTLRAQKGRP